MVFTQCRLHDSFEVRESLHQAGECEKKEENVTNLVEDIALAKIPHMQQKIEPRNAKEWGLFHEGSARKAYKRVASNAHHKLELVLKGFLISKSKPFLGASLDNSKCSDGCPKKVV